MSLDTIITLIIAGISLIATIVGWVVEIRKGNLKKFVEEKMAEAEESGKDGKEKLNYVLEEVKAKYKVKAFVDLAKKFIEDLIDFSKKVNGK